MANINYLFMVAPAECGAEYGVEGNSIVFFRNFDEKKIVYTGSNDPKTLLKWMQFYQLPIYSLNQAKFHGNAFENGVPTMYLFTKVDGKNYEKEFIKAAHEYYEAHSDPEKDFRIMWLKSSPRGDSYQSEITGYLGVDPKKPQLGVLDYLNSTFKHLSKMDITNFKAADFLKFADDF